MELEEKLIDEARRGSREAFSRLIGLHQAEVRAYLGRWARNREVVDDLAQETFLSAYRSMGDYKPVAPLRFWLFGIARNRALRHLREEQGRKARQAGSLEALLPAWLAEEAEAVGEADHELEVSALRACIEGLPPHSSGLVEDFYFKGRSADQISRETGKKENAIWVTLLRIRLALRTCIEGRLRSAGAV